MRDLKTFAGLTVGLALAGVWPAGSPAEALPFTISSNRATNSVNVQKSSIKDTEAGATVIGQEGGLVDGEYVGGGAGSTNASVACGLLCANAALGRIDMDWDALMQLDSAMPAVDVFLDWDMTVFAATSTFLADAGAGVKATIQVWGKQTWLGLPFPGFWREFTVTGTSVMDETFYIGRSSQWDYFRLLVSFDVISEASVVSLGASSASSIAFLDFTLWAADPPPEPDPVAEPSTMLLVGAGLMALRAARRRATSLDGRS